MISVSDDFKKAIKSDNREIYGYVDVRYQDKSYDTTVIDVPQALEIVEPDGSGLIAGSKIMNKYATLENNYTLLDGSFTVWNENIIYNGFISDELFENISNPKITIDNNTNTPTKGITIYFKENLPFDFDVTFVDYDGNEIIDNVHNNQSMIYQYVFSQEKTIVEVSITINQVEFPKNRIRIAYVDFNLSDLFEGDELVSFDVTEELDLLAESLPINNCEVHINNYPSKNGGNKFDPINPKGITGYLNANVTIRPYIGVLTEMGGVEYVPMGVFYLSNWSSNPNGNVTLNGESILSKLRGLIIHPTTSFFTSGLQASDLKDFIENSSNVNVSFISYSNPWHNQFLENEDLFTYISSVIPYLLYYDNFTEPHKQYRKFYVDRYNTIRLNALNFSSVSSLSRNELTSDVEYITKNKIKQINTKQNAYGVYSNYRSSTIISTFSHTMTNTEEYLWFKSDNQLVDGTLSLNYSVTSGSATATIVGYNNTMICVKLTGTIDSVISMSCSGDIADVESTLRSYTFYNNNVDVGETIDINLDKSINVTQRYFQNIYFELDRNYKVKAETLGDPSIAIGDTISVQTRYQEINDGYKDIIVTKQKFTFNGGLQCSIEGVGD